MAGDALIEIGGRFQRISELVQDMNGCKQIPEGAIHKEKQIGEVCI